MGAGFRADFADTDEGRSDASAATSGPRTDDFPLRASVGAGVILGAEGDLGFVTATVDALDFVRVARDLVACDLAVGTTSFAALGVGSLFGFPVGFAGRTESTLPRTLARRSAAFEVGSGADRDSGTPAVLRAGFEPCFLGRGVVERGASPLEATPFRGETIPSRPGFSAPV